MKTDLHAEFVLENIVVAVIGLGYVGLPLAVEFGKKFRTIGFDLNGRRIEELGAGYDATREVSSDELTASRQLQLTCDAEELGEANIYIVTVPTPIDDHKKPDLSPLRLASQTVGQYLAKKNIVVYESTVFPGATEEECVPILQEASGLVFNKDFYVGYSPERINPGDKKRRITNILKLTSGSTPEAADIVDRLYASIVVAGTHKVSSIKVAEAAKVIENTQRDLNIALVNELAIIFAKLGIDTEEVLVAAGTKWNFLPFRPGLVGGHCIGVDPYYLTHKAQALGYQPDVILSGRKINDGMGKYVAGELVKKMLKQRIHVHDSNILIMGVTFKEDCPDIRNSKVVDVVNELGEYGANVDIFDPHANEDDVMSVYGLSTVERPRGRCYDALVVAVAHSCFKGMLGEVSGCLKESSVVFDLKSILPVEMSDLRL